MTWVFHGHAIVSADDRIADADGNVPPALRNDADWLRFQAALDAAAFTVLGRLGHLANPNPKRRKRLVLSSSAGGVERREDGWWWDPAKAPLGDALAAVAPAGGVVAVTGGRHVFDLFLAVGYDRFDLARVTGLKLPGGVPVFSAVLAGHPAEATLAGNGLAAGPLEALDPGAGVSLTVWERARNAAVDGCRP